MREKQYGFPLNNSPRTFSVITIPFSEIRPTDYVRLAQLEVSSLPDDKRKFWKASVSKQIAAITKVDKYKNEAKKFKNTQLDIVADTALTFTNIGVEMSWYLMQEDLLNFADQNGMEYSRKHLEATIDTKRVLVGAKVEDYSLAQLLLSGDTPEDASKSFNFFTSALRHQKYNLNPEHNSEENYSAAQRYSLYATARLLSFVAGIVEFDEKYSGVTISLSTKEIISNFKNKIQSVQKNIREGLLSNDNENLRKQFAPYLENQDLEDYLYVALGLNSPIKIADYMKQIEYKALEMEDSTFYEQISNVLFANLGANFPVVFEIAPDEQVEAEDTEDEENESHEQEPVAKFPGKKKEVELNSVGTENKEVKAGNSKLLKRMQIGVKNPDLVFEGFARPVGNR